ncbi:MAG TPA: MMPL family transporter [Gaiellaceae bacterium]|nr:MMPL family transporter [Gaiellaceae bacterium]
MGRWSASHWKTAVFGWLAFVLASVAIGNAVKTKHIDQNDTNVGQAHRADVLLRQAGFGQTDPQTEIVLIQATGSTTVESAAFRAAVNDVVHTVAPFQTIKNLRSPLDPAYGDQVSPDGRTALVEWEMKGSADTAKTHIDAITAKTDAVAKRHPSLYIGEAGSISSGKALDKMFSDQLAQAGERSIPLTLAILVLVFGSLVAAGVPLLLALSAVLATMGLLAIPSHLVPMDQSVSAVVLLVGLAVGVDYALFYLKREREERAAGKGHRAALEAAAATSGRSVLISGVTVMTAMAGLLFTGDKTFVSFGVATMLVVLVAMIGSLTVLPALLARLGDKVEKGRIPFLSRVRRPSGENRVWSWILTPALKRPVVAASAAVALLLVLASPLLHLHTAQSGLDALPKNAPTVETIDRIQHSFVGEVAPAEVAVTTPSTDSAEFKNAVNAFRAAAIATGKMHGPIDVDVNRSHTAARIEVPLAGKGTDGASNAALLALRSDVLPSTIGRVQDTTWAVTGQTAASYDANANMKHNAPLVFGFVLAFAFLLLLVSFRSIVIAAKAVVLNLLSVAAAYGVVIAVFQWGWGENVLNFNSNGGIAQWLPLFMFVILFGLSMDYHVFILSRIREAYDRGLSTEDAVAHGIKTTAGTVSSAALVMVGVFMIFATLPFLDFKEMGIGLAAAVLIDATIVRGVLLPASMKLLGDWNWYLPNWLGWLPKLEHGSEAAPQAA